jgi:hypothetical protein
MSNFRSCILWAMVAGSTDAGCGKVQVTTDAASDSSNEVTIDGAMGAIDAFVQPGPRRFWYIGDTITDGVDQAGTFTDIDAAPIAVVPFPATGSMQPFGLGQVRFPSFSAAAAADKIAYVADSTVAGRFDLFVANGDGTQSTIVLESPGGIAFRSIYLSPNGRKVAFLNASRELFVVDVGANPVAVKVNPPLVPGGFVSTNVTWSPDSKYIGYSARVNNQFGRECLIADTSVLPPVSASLIGINDLMPPPNQNDVAGSFSSVQFDNVNRAYVILKRNTVIPAEVRRANVDGSEKTKLDLIPAPVFREGVTRLLVRGDTIVAAAESSVSGRYDFFAASAADPTTAVKVSPSVPFVLVLNAADDVEISPDKKKLVYRTYSSPGMQQLVVLRLNNEPSVAISTVSQFPIASMSWSADSSFVYALSGPSFVDANVSRFRSDVAEQVPDALVTATHANGGINALLSGN